LRRARLQVEHQSALISRAEQQLADLEAERRRLAARAAEAAAVEDELRQRAAAVDRREAELAGEASRWAACGLLQAGGQTRLNRACGCHSGLTQPTAHPRTRHPQARC
jgi:uncharacterized protein (DUF3084 family)